MRKFICAGATPVSLQCPVVEGVYAFSRRKTRTLRSHTNRTPTPFSVCESMQKACHAHKTNLLATRNICLAMCLEMSEAILINIQEKLVTKISQEGIALHDHTWALVRMFGCEIANLLDWRRSLGLKKQVEIPMQV